MHRIKKRVPPVSGGRSRKYYSLIFAFAAFGHQLCQIFNIMQKKISGVGSTGR